MFITIPPLDSPPPADPTPPTLPPVFPTATPPLLGTSQTGQA